MSTPQTGRTGKHYFYCRRLPLRVWCFLAGSFLSSLSSSILLSTIKSISIALCRRSSPQCIMPHNHVPMAPSPPRVRRHRASRLQSSYSYECCLFFQQQLFQVYRKLFRVIFSATEATSTTFRKSKHVRKSKHF